MTTTPKPVPRPSQRVRVRLTFSDNLSSLSPMISQEDSLPQTSPATTNSAPPSLIPNKKIRRRKRSPEARTSILGEQINRECAWIDHRAEVLGAGLDLITEQMYCEGREESQSGR